MNNKRIARKLLALAHDLIYNAKNHYSYKTARGQERIRKEIQNSAQKCLEALKVPQELSGVNWFYAGDFTLHHIDQSKKFKLDGTMTI